MKETNRIEFKRELSDDLEKEVIAFLNYREGGKIFIGINDDGSSYGVPDFDAVQLKIKDRLKTNIQPSCLGLFDVIHEVQDGKDIIQINIASGTEKPYYLKKRGMSEKGCFIRVGSASEPMNSRQIEELFAKRTRNSLSKIVSNRQDLTFEQLKIYYNTQGFELNNKFLKSLDLFTPSGQYNYVAYLLADDNSVSMKVAKYAGTDKTDLVENVEFGYCSIIKATHSILDKLDVENKTFVKITGAAERLQKQMIDKTALREALINAIVHNDYTSEVPPVVEIYSDRLSITSYGGLVHGLSQEEFFAGRSMPRNRELMRVFRDLRLVEQLGSGIHRILKAYNKDIFKMSDNFMEISFPYEKEYLNKEGGQIGGQIELVERLVEGLVESQKKIVILVAENPKISKKDMSEKIGISTTAIDKNIEALKKKNIIKRVGSDRSGSWQIMYPSN
jgi:ATP-dependent DNA helicase RecG